IACPIILTTLLIHSRSIVSTLFLSHLGDIELAGGSLALGFYNITGVSIMKGLSVGMDPICGQAFGAKRWAVLSQTFQKMLCLLLFASTLLICLLWLNLEPIFLRHSLGAGQPTRAQWTAIIGITLAFGYAVIACVFTALLRSDWGKLYTSDPEVIEMISIGLPIVGLCELGNAPQTAACGVLTGTARPKEGARINLFAFYLVGFPVAILLTFQFKMGYRGLWLGLFSAQIACVSMMLYTILRTDWKHQAKRAEELTAAVGERDDIEDGLLPSNSDHQ
ncbi:Protein DETOXIFICATION 53, partial [Linum perenne]